MRPADIARSTRSTRLAATGLAALLALGLAACGGSAGAPAWSFAPPPGTGAATPSPAPSASPVAGRSGMMGGGDTMGSGGMMGGGASQAPAASPGQSPVAGLRIEVSLGDALRITPSAMSVPAGVAVTFVVHNTGTVLHEFTLGDAAEQAAHEAEMQANGGMTMASDEPMAIGVAPGTTKELTVTCPAAGTVYAACHVAGHWQAGMQAVITVG